MPRFDYECQQCWHVVRDQAVARSDAFVWCQPCADKGLVMPMTKLPAAPAFSVKGFNASNGYSKQ